MTTFRASQLTSASLLLLGEFVVFLTISANSFSLQRCFIIFTFVIIFSSIHDIFIKQLWGKKKLLTKAVHGAILVRRIIVKSGIFFD